MGGNGEAMGGQWGGGKGRGMGIDWGGEVINVSGWKRRDF